MADKSLWKRIETAPKNPEGEGYGPWILIWYGHSPAIYQARWQFSNGSGGWVPIKEEFNKLPAQHKITHWQHIPKPPKETP